METLIDAEQARELVRRAYIEEVHNHPMYAEMVETIKQAATEGHSSIRIIAFPRLFEDYLLNLGYTLEISAYADNATYVMWGRS